MEFETVRCTSDARRHVATAFPGTALLREYDSWVPIAFYILFAGAISLIAAFSLHESKGLSLRTIDAEDMHRLTAASAM